MVTANGGESVTNGVSSGFSKYIGSEARKKSRDYCDIIFAILNKKIW